MAISHEPYMKPSGLSSQSMTSPLRSNHSAVNLPTLLHHFTHLYILLYIPVFPTFLSQASSPFSTMQKPCTLCSTPRSILVRCQIDASQTWNFVCPGACWKAVSGGVEDARDVEKEFPWYRYGGMVRQLIYCCRGEGIWNRIDC